MKLPVDTSALVFLCAVEAEPVVDFETRRSRGTDRRFSDAAVAELTSDRRRC